MSETSNDRLERVDEQNFIKSINIITDALTNNSVKYTTNWSSQTNLPTVNVVNFRIAKSDFSNLTGSPVAIYNLSLSNPNSHEKLNRYLFPSKGNSKLVKFLDSKLAPNHDPIGEYIYVEIHRNEIEVNLTFEV